MVNAIPREVLMPSTKYVGLSYPTHFLKSRGSVIRNNFLEYRTNKATHFARRNDLYALLAKIKQNIYSIDFYQGPVVTKLMVKVKRKIVIKSHFQNLPFH